MVETTNLTRRFGNFVAVDQVSLHVQPGSLLALLGPNGAGKTTTVRMLSGLLAPHAGEATVAGYNVRFNPAQVRARVGLVTDSPGLYEQMTLLDYLDFFGSLYGLAGGIRQQRINELITFFELNDQGKNRMVGFSKGMKQKVALARALLPEPSVLFLDEPTSGLDPLSTRNVRDLIVQLKHASRTIILCTHDLDEAERLADLVAIMNHGHIVAMDTPAALRANASPVTLVQIMLAVPFQVSWEELRGIDGVIVPELPRDEAIQQLDYQTARPDVVNPQVIAHLARSGAQIITVNCITRTLEDVYAAIIGQQEHAISATINTRTTASIKIESK